MNRIDFSFDWNGKVTAAHIFTTIRARAKYGHLQTGELVEIWLNGRFVTHADVIEVRPLDRSGTSSADLIAMLDTGKPTAKQAWDTLDGFLQGQDGVIIVLRRTQASLFGS